jgi:predicted transposase YdaD
MKNAVFWDIETHFLPHRKHMTFPLQCPADYIYVRYEDFTSVTMKNVVFLDKKTPVCTSQETYYVSATEPS